MPDPSKQVLITRDEEVPAGEDRSDFVARHPDLSYVFGPTIRGFYVVGCLALDLLAPIQILALLPGQEALAVPALVLAFASLSYPEYRLYRRLWPSPRGREVVGVAGTRRF